MRYGNQCYQTKIIKIYLDDCNLRDKKLFCFQWYGALLHFTTEGIGLKHKIQTAYTVREHFDVSQ